MTLRAFEQVLLEPGVLIAGSEAPNLLQSDARSTLVVSRDVDIVVPVEKHAQVKARLRGVRAFAPSREESSVWLPVKDDLLEVNFIGMDARPDREGQTYVLEDGDLPLLVFANLALLRPGMTRIVESLALPLPRPAGLLLEKIVTDRSGEKGDRDLLVALAVLLVCAPPDLEEIEEQYRGLPAELRHQAKSGLATLSLLTPRTGMPDPVPHRGLIARLMEKLDRMEEGR